MRGEWASPGLLDRPPASPAERVRTELLAASDSPRVAGENPDYVNLLVESETRFPPILVHRATMRVVDGMHRLRAAVVRGDTHIDVQFFDGDEREAFVLAVELNNAHGLPLSLADRTTAACRIIASHPHWSDRVIAATTGLAAKTVSAIRRRATDASTRLHTRIGRDGRVRPLDSAEGRRRASDLIAKQPDASLRTIARAAGISPTTVRDVRQRMSRGDDPVPPPRQRGPRRAAGNVTLSELVTPGVGQPRDRKALSASLCNDPSLRFTEKGRLLLRILAALNITSEQWGELIDTIPPHSMLLVHGAAAACAEAWQEFAEHVERRLRATEQPELPIRIPPELPSRTPAEPTSPTSGAKT
ncbi:MULTISPECIES: transcriptional regulator protein [unclassified Micromonospora]|uniref:ParB/RepB/Spo0J family partition protein n=1 Tax=unclassified Micromonospora TaxID=2617518 RepID=UPI00364497E2